MNAISCAPQAGASAPLWCQNNAPFLALIDDFPISKKAKNQFRKALTEPSTSMLDKFLLPALWDASSADRGEHSYICVSDTGRVEGRNHLASRMFATNSKFDGYDLLKAEALFANRLRVDYQGEATGTWVPPMQRVLGGGPVVFTVEYDQPDLGFFESQMAWCRSAKNKLDAPVGAVYRHFSQFADFLGLTVVWSGHKSLHLHVMFDSHLVVALAGLDATMMRDGFKVHWDTVAAQVSTLLDVPDHIKPDAALRQPEAFRRLPWGARENDKANHLLGVPVGTMIPQAVLWEQWRGRSGNGVEALFLRPDLFVVTPERRKVLSSKGVGGAPSCGPLPEADRLYCEQRLKEEVTKRVAAAGAAGPKLYRLEFERGTWVARFMNSASDSNPSSIMRADHNRVLLCGRDAALAAPIQLPQPLAAMMKLWLAQRTRQSAATTDIVEVDPVRARALTPVEQQFQDAVIDTQIAMKVTQKTVHTILRQHDRAIIKGPEGSGKSSALISEFHKIMGRHAGRRDITGERGAEHAIFAFATYDMAAKKVDAFNAVQGKHGYRAVLLHSFERLYQQVCEDKGVRPFTTEDALRAGCDHIRDLIKVQQPDVFEAMKARHCAVWANVGLMKPVFFTVHGVAENWTKQSYTRLWWHRDFFGEFSQKTQAKMMWEMRLALLVYDEVKVETFITRHQEGVVAWMDRLRQTCPAWRSSKGKARARYSEFAAHVASEGLPVINGQPVTLTFHEAQQLRSLSTQRRETVTLSYSGEYDRPGQDDKPSGLYGQVAGRRWCVHPRNWWGSVADKVLVLTTETLPTLVASRLGWQVVELECPKVEQSLIDVHFHRLVSSARVGQMIQWFRVSKKHGIVAISNKAKSQPDTYTHHAAKGDNDFIGEDLMQTMLHVNPDEYESLEVINAWTGIDRAVRLRHVDELNQTAGRNLGFRWDGKAEHHLLISPSLFLKIWDVLFEVSRYGFRLQVTATKRAEIKRAKA